MPGPVHTAQRAEVWAVWAALGHVQGGLRLCSDSRNVVDTLGKSHEDALRAGAPRLDLWVRIWEQRQRVKEVRWIRAHLTWEEAKEQGWTHELWAGNQQADRLATEGVGGHREDPVYADTRKNKLELAVCIQSYILRRFRTLAIRRSTQWGQAHRAERRIMGPRYLASFRLRQEDTREEK